MNGLKSRFCSEKFSSCNLLTHCKLTSCEIFGENGPFNRTDFIPSIRSGSCQKQCCFNEQNSPERQMIQAAARQPSVGKICSETHQSGKGHYDAPLSRRGFGGSAHLSAISPGSQDRWSAGCLVLLVYSVVRLQVAGETLSSVSL